MCKSLPSLSLLASPLLALCSALTLAACNPGSTGVFAPTDFTQPRELKRMGLRVRSGSLGG